MGRKSVAAFLVCPRFPLQTSKELVDGLKRKNDSSDFLGIHDAHAFPEDKFNPSIMSLVCRKRKPENEPSKTAKKTTTRKKKQLSQDECRLRKSTDSRRGKKKRGIKWLEAAIFQAVG